MEGKLVIVICLMLFVPFISGDDDSESEGKSKRTGEKGVGLLKCVSSITKPITGILSKYLRKGYGNDDDGGCGGPGLPSAVSNLRLPSKAFLL